MIYNFQTIIDKSLMTIEEYQGEEIIALSCTQLNEIDFPNQKQKNKILDDWIRFFQGNPKKFKIIHCTTRMNQKLFNAICQQENLVELVVKWGVYPDLTEIKNLKTLKYLSLGAGSSTKDISPISELTGLRVLDLSMPGVIDYSPLKWLTELNQLRLISGMDNLVKAENLEFLKGLSKLKNFTTTGFRLLNHDYSPVFGLKQLEVLSINMPASDQRIWEQLLADKLSYVPNNKHRKRIK